MNSSTVKIRDYNGAVLNVVEHPAIVYDKDTYTLFRIGEASEIKEYYEKLKSIKCGYDEICQLVDSIAYMELPNNQELIDNLFNITGYLGQFIRQCETIKA